MGIITGIIMFGIAIFVTIAATLFTTTSGLKEQYTYQNMNERLESAARDFQTKYFADYDYLNVPMGRFPSSTSDPNSDSALGTLIINSNRLLNAIDDPARNAQTVYLNSKRVCVKLVPKNTDDTKYVVTCSGFPEGQISGVAYNLLTDVDYSRGFTAVNQLLSSLGGDIFVTLGRNNVKYINNEFPSLRVSAYPSAAGNKVDGDAAPYVIDIDKGVNERILEAKGLMDKIYAQYGEKVKRDHKGYAKSDQVSPFNPFAVMGDAVKAESSKRLKYVNPKTNSSTDSEGDENVYEKYFIVGDNQKEGFGTSNALVLSYGYLDANSVSLIGGLAGCVVYNDEFERGASLTPYFSNRYFLVCDEPRNRVYRNKCVSDDDKCKEEPVNTDLLLENFCLSTEPCYVKYETEKDVIKSMEVMSADYMLRKKFNLGVETYQNPFYPNAEETLHKEEQKGMIFSSNNQAIPSSGGKSFFVMGLKFVPTKEAYRKSDSLANENFYILNKYIIQSK